MRRSKPSRTPASGAHRSWLMEPTPPVDSLYGCPLRNLEIHNILLLSFHLNEPARNLIRAVQAPFTNLSRTCVGRAVDPHVFVVFLLQCKKIFGLVSSLVENRQRLACCDAVQTCKYRTHLKCRIFTSFCAIRRSKSHVRCL